MKQLVKMILPNSIVAKLQQYYWRQQPEKPKLSQEEYDALDALKCTIAYNKYGGYCVPLSSQHRPAAKRALAGDVYEPQTIEFILANCKDGDMVHAGTYFGDMIPAFSRAVGADHTLWAFEPNPENHRCANITRLINGLDNVVLTNAGLGDHSHTVQMHTSDAQGKGLGGASRLLAEGEGQEVDGGTDTVRIVTIDETVPEDRNVAIIQLDVEGHEKEALGGALKTINRCRPMIIVEVLEESTLLQSGWFADNIIALGYREIEEIDGNSIFVCDR